MNHYPHHIGDYDSDTAHLEWVEDMAYTRLLRLYYRSECPIPADVAQACRLVRARSKQERDAVESVLKEFFELADDGWHNKRADNEIAHYQEKAKRNREVGKKGGRPRTQIEPTNNPDGFWKETQTEPTNNPNQNQNQNQNQTHTARASPAGIVCKAMRDAGLGSVNPGDPRLIALLEAGATEAEFRDAALDAVARAKGFAYALGVLRGKREDAAKPLAEAVAQPDRMAEFRSAI